MSYRLPPLNALKVFEATSRLLSGRKAAEELHITPAAVSHQIKLLETYLGFRLFNRLNRQLYLTEMGQRYSRTIQELFKKLADETEKLTQTTRSHLTLSVEPSFAIYWLIPRINKFKSMYPNIELRISSSYKVENLLKNNIDIGVRWGKGQYPGLTSVLLFHNKLYPVCSPQLLKKHTLKKVNDLKKLVLLHEKDAMTQPDYPDWRDWVKKFKATEVNPESGLFLETGYLVIQAALDGQGVALERIELVKSAIQSGKLIRLFNLGIRETVNAYYLVFSEEKAFDPKMQSFIRWIKSEIG